MRSPATLALLVALILSGCAAPESEPLTPTEGPIDLTGELGLLVIDRLTRAVQALTEQRALAWMSENATILTWSDVNFHIVVVRTTGARDVGPSAAWARVHENGTGLELTPGRALWRDLVSGVDVANETLGPTPPGIERWTQASEDLAVLGAEVQGERRLLCQNDIVLRADRLERTRGCHLRISADGRAGWTESDGVRIREMDGTILNLTGPGAGDPSADAYVAHENPVFTGEGVVMLRVRGGDEVALTEVVDDEGTIYATMDGPRRLALHDASLDGRYLMLTAFDR